MTKKFKTAFGKKLRNTIKNWNSTSTIVLFFVVFFLMIIKTLFEYTVLDYEYYTNLADAQQIGTVTVPVNRGTIHSGGNRSIVLGTSLHLYDLAVDPQMEGDKEKLATFLVDIVYNELCEKESKKNCESNVERFLRVLEIENFSNDESFVKNLLSERIVTKLLQTKVTSVLIDKELTEEDITKIKNLQLPGLYPSNNYLYVNPEEFDNNEQNIKKLSEIMGTNEENLTNLTRKRNLRYISIINKLSIESSDYIQNYITEEKDALSKGVLLKEKSISSFFILTANPNRYYPEGDLAAQVIGFVDNSGVGNYGVEGYFNDILKGNNGEIVSRKDTSGRIIDTISLNEEELLGEGVQIYLTIDRNIQKRVEEILEEGVKRYQANKGKVTIMNPKTGEIIAMANYPSYDLNDFGDVYELEKVKYTDYPNPGTDLLGYPILVEDSETGERFVYDNKEIYLREATREELGDMLIVKYKYKNDYGSEVYRNDIISSLFEPGSIMKPLTVAIGLDTGEITTNSTYNDEGYVKIDNFTIKNVSNQCLGYHTFGHALNRSCNVGMIRIAQKIGKTLMYQYLQDFGIGVLTGIELQGEANSKLEDWEKWSMAGLFTRSYGLGVSLTQLQMATAYSVLANGGVYVKPKIVDKVVYPDGREVVYKTEELRRVIKESTSKTIIDMMYDGTHSGQGLTEGGHIEGYRFALKSGTAQIAYRGQYETGVASTVGSFAGFGPIEDPQFVMVVTLERPRTSEYGSSTAGKIWQEIGNYLVDYYEIPKRV